MTSRRALLARTTFLLAIATPALAQPFIIPLGRQPARPESPPPPSPVPVAPPQAGPSSDALTQPSEAPDPAANTPPDAGNSQSPR